jgi:hypothetical protein
MTWFSAWVRAGIFVEDSGVTSYRNHVRVVEADSENQAIAKVVALELADEEEYLNSDRKKVSWRLLEIRTLDRIGDEISGKVVGFRRVAIEDPEDLNVDRIFIPKASKTISTTFPQGLSNEDEENEELDIVWASTWLRFITCGGKTAPTYFEEVLIVFPCVFGRSREKTLALGERMEETFSDGSQRVFVEIFPSPSNFNTIDGTEVYGEFHDGDGDDSYDFDYQFNPNNLKPAKAMTDAPGWVVKWNLV